MNQLTAQILAVLFLFVVMTIGLVNDSYVGLIIFDIVILLMVIIPKLPKISRKTALLIAFWILGFGFAWINSYYLLEALKSNLNLIEYTIFLVLSAFVFTALIKNIYLEEEQKPSGGRR